MKPLRERSQLGLVMVMGIGTATLFSSGCSTRIAGYPIASDAPTTLERTVTFDAVSTPARIDEPARFHATGHGIAVAGPGLPSDKRNDIMAAAYDGSSVTTRAPLLRFFSIADIHITDEESPSQAIYIQQMTDPATGKQKYALGTSAYSPVMLYTTQVLDAAIQTVNALHRKAPIDFGISLGDTCNSTQYNELRWYIDVIDGKLIDPSSGAHAGAGTVDYQKPYQAAGLDKAIPWYQAIGNHDHFWIGTNPMSEYLRQSYTSDTILALGDVLGDPDGIEKRDYYMGTIDGSTPYGTIILDGPVGNFASPPKVVADPDRRPLPKTEWMKEFFTTSTSPAGHGFSRANVEDGFASYSFQPKSKVPVKVIVLDDTQRDDDADVHGYGHGALDQQRHDWLVKELDDGQAAGQLMIVAAHVPLGVDNTEPRSSPTLPFSFTGWSDAVSCSSASEAKLIAKLQTYPNLLMWMAGHRHLNTVKPFASTDPAHPENGFWQVETASLRDFPQQFRTFAISVNSDYTVSIITTDVDPAVEDGTPAATSRAYAIATQQITDNGRIYQPAGATADASIKPMPTASYNAELVKQLSPAMVEKLKTLY